MPVSRLNTVNKLPTATPPTAAQGAPERKGTFRGTEVSFVTSAQGNQLPPSHSSDQPAKKPVLSRRANIINAIKSIVSRIFRAFKNHPLTLRWRKHHPVNPNHPKTHSAQKKSASNVSIAPRMVHMKEILPPLSENIVFINKDAGLALIHRMTEEEKRLNKKISLSKVIAKIKHIAALAKPRYFGKAYPGRGLPDSLLEKYKNPALIIVKGYGSNPFGHALLGFESPKGERFYAQINNLYAHPDHMTEEECAKYMAEEAGTIRLEYRPPLKASRAQIGEDHKKMQEVIQKYAQKRWQWGGPVHNCYNYGLDILEAAGYDISALSDGIFYLPTDAIKAAEKRSVASPIT
ncbi:hypothetical protein [Candidatus Sororendozoicomonas aggregata]|uniref:hypothetical protein n=1 Tax=Candidatus Sororendozoicomonas aggregata TaxID=3073239 RepID=UPI002ED2F668